MTTLAGAPTVVETITPKGSAAVLTGVAHAQLVRSRSFLSDEDAQVQGWNCHIGKIVADWAIDLGSLDDGEFTPPSRAVIDFACEIAIDFRDRGEAAPDRVVLDGDGGIVFERRRGDVIEMIEIYGETEVKAELIGMKCGKVFFRQEILTVER